MLAEGSKVAAERFGGDSAKFAMQVKGLEQSGYESRRAPAMLLSYMTSDIGAHHRPSWAVTHDIATARHFAHRIVVMYLGVIVESGSARAVVGNPLHPYTQALMAAVPEPDPANRLRERPVLSGEPPSPADVPKGCSFHPRCPSYMRGTCEMARPHLVEAEPDHCVACYLHPGDQPVPGDLDHRRSARASQRISPAE